MQAMFEAEIAEACGLNGKHDLDRSAVRHGIGKGSVTLGGRRMPVDRPRAGTLDGHEVPLTSYAHFASEDMFTQVVMERMLAGVATRRHARAAEPIDTQVDKEAKSTSRSAISRRFVRQTQTALAELMARDLSREDIKVLMLDGEHLAKRCVVVALAATVREVFGAKALIQRCRLHKRRNLADHLPAKEQAWVDAKLVKAFSHPDPSRWCTTPNILPHNLRRATPVLTRGTGYDRVLSV
jgi:putative transposase